MSNKAENKEINTLNKYIGAQQVLESGLGLEPEGKKRSHFPTACRLVPLPVPVVLLSQR